MNNHINFSYFATPYCINHFPKVHIGVVSVNLYWIPLICKDNAETPQTSLYQQKQFKFCNGYGLTLCKKLSHILLMWKETSQKHRP